MRASIFVTILLVFSTSVLCEESLDGVVPCHDPSKFFDEAGFFDANENGVNELGDYFSTYCHKVQGVSGAAVCMAGPLALDDDGGRYKMSYRLDGKSKISWMVNGSSLIAPKGFTVESVDLDGNSRDEVVIGVLESVSNGIAIERWSLYILSEAGDLIGTVSLENYGEMSGFYRFPGMRGCLLLAAKWMGGSDSKRGPGTYVKGEWFRLSNGVVGPSHDLPEVSRRYLHSFENERRSDKRPLLWFKPPKHGDQK